MSALLSDLALAFWRLVPANPILVRVVQGASRRSRHLWLRAGFLAAIIFAVLVSLSTAISAKSSLAELAKGASQSFKLAAYIQLAWMCILAPVFTAGAITQERDAQTYSILLSTPMSNAQIVLGSLLSRLYFLIMLLVAALPVFLVTMIYGGVTTSQVLESFTLGASTAIVTGSLAIAVSVIRAGTRKTVFYFYMCIAVYLLAIYLAAQWAYTWVPEAPLNAYDQRMSALAPLHPFLAMEVALNRVQAPDVSQLPTRGRLMRFLLSQPSAAYVAWTLALSVLMVGLSVFFVRSGVRQGEPTLFGRLLARFGVESGAERRRTPRSVWRNPVAWREAQTQTSLTSHPAMKYGLVLLGLAVSITLLVSHLTQGSTMTTLLVRQWLAGLIMLQFTLVILMTANSAATSFTKEKESNSLDVLLTTPLTSEYIVWGKLRGLVSFAAPLLTVPVLSILVFAIYGLVGDIRRFVWIESVLEVAACMLVYVAGCGVACLTFSLQCKKSVKAVMYSMGTILLITGVLSLFAQAMAGTDARFGAFLAPLTPLTAIMAALYPEFLFQPGSAVTPTDLAEVRFALAFGCVLINAVWCAIISMFYRSLVKDFDMTLRKQTAS